MAGKKPPQKPPQTVPFSPKAKVHVPLIVPGSKLDLNVAKSEQALIIDEDGNASFQETAPNAAALRQPYPVNAWLLRGLAEALMNEALRPELHSLVCRAMAAAGYPQPVPGKENLERI